MIEEAELPNDFIPQTRLVISKQNQPFHAPPLKATASEPVVAGRPQVQVASDQRFQRLENQLTGSVRVTYSRKVRRITLERFICGKLVWQQEKVTYQEILVLYDNLLWCQEKARVDPGFRTKFGPPLEVLTKILKETRFSRSNILRSISKLSQRIKSELEGFYFPRRNMSTVERHTRGTFHILDYRETGTPTKQLPPKKYIGVGYKDKGNARNKAVDGSPSWQDVAMRGNLQ